MASPLPTLPASPLPRSPQLPQLPANPLPRLHIGRKDSGPRLPRLFRGGHAPRPPLARPTGGAQRPTSASQAPVVHIHQAAPAATTTPQTTPGGKLTRAQVRTHAHGYLGQRMGGRVNNLSPQAQQAIQVLQRRYAGHLVRGHNQAGVAWLNQQKAKHKAQQPQTPPQGAGMPPAVKAKRAQQYAQMRATLNGMQTPPPPPAPGAPQP